LQCISSYSSSPLVHLTEFKVILMDAKNVTKMISVVSVTIVIGFIIALTGFMFF